MLLKQPIKVIFGFYLALLRRTIVTAQVNMSSAPRISDESPAPEMFSVAYITVPDIDVGKKIAGGLVTNKLAACVNIIPGITSIYEWKGKINEDSELLLMVKTRTSKVKELTEFVRSNHPYEVCEVISLPIHDGNPPYLKWIEDTVPEKI